MALFYFSGGKLTEFVSMHHFFNQENYFILSLSIEIKCSVHVCKRNIRRLKVLRLDPTIALCNLYEAQFFLQAPTDCNSC